MSTLGNRTTPPDPPGSRPADPTRLYLVRHGQSTWNDERRIQGQLDPPLSDLGREQARRLADRLRGREFAAVYASDLARAADTGRLLAAAVERPLELLPAAREVALGDWEGRTRDELVRDDPGLWQRWVDEPSWDIPPGSEGSAAFEGRVRNLVELLFGRHPGEEVALVTHGGVIQVALGSVLGRSSNGLFPYVIDNTSITVLVRGPRRTVIGRVNDTAHLEPRHSGSQPATARADRSGGLGQY